MNNDKFETRSKNSGKKAIAMLLVMVLLLGAAIGTTLAWLIDKTTPVVNTFTVGNIDITLTEVLTQEGATANAQTFPVIPGSVVTKEADVTVEAGSEACWLFVKIEENGDHANNWIQWTVADPWQPIANDSNVYYIEVNKATAAAGKTYDVLANDEVTISGEMTKEYVDNLTADPTITFTAYAIQSEKLNAADAAAAWNLLQDNLT